MKEFFEHLEKKGIHQPPDAMEILMSMDPFEVFEFAIEAFVIANAVGSESKREKSLFNFSANTAISGGPFPCSDIQCRLENARRFATFSVLYSDHILVPNFMDYLYHEDFKFKHPEQVYNLCYRIASDITVYLYYKPLFDEGIISVNPTQRLLCPDCLRVAVAEEEEFSAKLDMAAELLEQNLSGRILFEMDTKSSIIMHDPEHLFDNEVFEFVIPPRKLKPFAKRAPYTFTPEEALKLRLVEYLLGPVLSDVFLNKVSHVGVGHTYLTGRAIDSEIIDLINKDEPQRGGVVLPGTFEHALPFVENVDINRLIELREGEGAVFEHYRVSLSRVAKEAGTEANQKVIAEAMRDVVSPELAKIDAVIENNRKYFQKKAGKKIVTSAAIGIMSHSIFHIDPSIIAGLLGPAVGPSAFDDIISAQSAPTEALNNPYYFLWKVKAKK